MKKKLLLIIHLLSLTLFASNALAMEFVCVLYDQDAEIPDVPHDEPRPFYHSYRTSINICDTETNTVTNLIRTGIAFNIKVLTSGEIYFMSDDYVWALNEEISEAVGYEYWDWEFHTRYIKRLPPVERNDEGFIEYGDEEIVYEFPLTAYGEPTYWDDFEIRTLPSGENRIYFSLSYNFGNGEIFYIDETGSVQLYYTLNPDEVVVPSCESMVGYWRGNFTFDGDDNLYLSSGNHIPSSLYRITGAFPDYVDSESYPEVIHNHPNSLEDFIFESPDTVYFQRRSSGSTVFGGDKIFQLELGDPTEEVIFHDPEYDVLRSFDLNDVRAIIGFHPSTSMVKGELITGMPKFRSEYLGKITKDHMGPPDISIYSIEYGKPEYLHDGTSARIPFRIGVLNSGGLHGRAEIQASVQLGMEKETRNVPFLIHGQHKIEQRSHYVHAGREVAFGGSIMVKHPQGKKLYGETVTGTIFSNSEKLDKNINNNSLMFKFTLPKEQDF